jgi:hypothetical protein
LKDLNEMVERRALEIVNSRLDDVFKNGTEHQNSNTYIMTEKNEEDKEFKTEFRDVKKAISYLSRKYDYKMSRASFTNLAKRLDEKVSRETKLDKVFRNKVLKIEKFKKNP